MKLIGWILGVLGALVVLPIIALGIFVATFDMNKMKHDVLAQLNQKLGREVAINGKVGIEFKDGLAIDLNDVQISSPAGFASKDFAKIGSLKAALNWKALVRRELDVKSIYVADAAIHLQTNAAGKNNWDFKMEANNAAPVPLTGPAMIPAKQEITDEEVADAAKKEIENVMKGGKPDFTIKQVALNHLELKNTVIKMSDARTGKSQIVAFDQGLFAMPIAAPFTADAKGKYNDAAFDVNFAAEKGAVDLLSGRATPIDLKAKYMGEAYAVKGMFAHSPNAIQINNMQAQLKGMVWRGVLQVATGGAKPAITGDLQTDLLNLPALSSAKPVSAAAEQEEKLLATPIVAEKPAGADLSFLKAFNADLKLAIGQIIASPTLNLNKVNTQAVVGDGRLRLNNLVFTLLDTPYRGLVEIDGNAPRNPVTHVVLNGANINLVELAKAFNSKMPVDSHGDIATDIRLTGLDPQAMTNSLTGKIEVVLGPGTVDTGGADRMGVGLAKFLFPGGAVQNNPRISCAAMRFNAVNGVLNTNGMVVDTNAATIGGDGSINLGAQTVNLTLKPVPKGLKGSDLFVVPVRVSGPSASPSFMPDENAALNKATAILTGNRQPINTGVPQVEATGKGNACLVAINNPKPIMLTPPTAKEAVQQVKEQAKDVINLGKDIFKGGRDAAKGDKGSQDQAIDKLKQLKGIFGQ